jgi:hypothetical protein
LWLPAGILPCELREEKAKLEDAKKRKVDGKESVVQPEKISSPSAFAFALFASRAGFDLFDLFDLRRRLELSSPLAIVPASLESRPSPGKCLQLSVKTRKTCKSFVK